MEEPSLETRVATWKRVLSPWIAALWGRLSLTLDCTPRREDLHDDLWIEFNAQDKADTRLAWHAWLEAFELLDLLASNDSRACWKILLDLRGRATAPTHLGCTLESLYGLRPRFEASFHFLEGYIPRQQDVVSLLSNGIAENDHTPEYVVAKAELLALAGPRNHSPVQVRWRFVIPAFRTFPEINWDDVLRNEVRLNHVLVLAKALATGHKTYAPCHRIASFGFCSTVHTTPEARDIIRRIACVIPVHTLVLKESARNDPFHNDFCGPFLWRMLAPQPSLRPHLGLQRVWLTFNQLQRPDSICAVYSAIAHSHTLREFGYSGQCSRGMAAWLSFALFSKSTTHNIRTASLSLTSGASAFLESLSSVVEHANPVAHMVDLHEGRGTARRLINWPATAVRVNAHTAIDVRDELLPVKTVYHGKQDAMCHVTDNGSGENVRVLIPGVGFGRIPRKDVISEEPTVMRETHSVRSLILSFNYTEVKHFASVLSLIGAPLTKLSLVSTGGKGSLPRLTEIFAACPQLEHLTLANLTLSIETLLPSRFGRHLQSLTLRECKVTTQESHYKLCITPKMAPQLTTLYISYGCSVEGVSLRAFAIELLTRRRLERLVVRSPFGEVNDETENSELMARFNGQRVPAMPLRQKLAFLSIVATENARFRVCNEIAALIFELACSPVQRRCCTLVGL